MPEPDPERVPEPLADRAVYLLLALLTAAGFFIFISGFNPPAHDGADQNGYLVAAKQLAVTGSAQLPARNADTGEHDPYAFVGRMWIAAGGSDTEPPERYYPKYPLGGSAVHALALRFSPQFLGPAIVYWISPFCMALALLATFLLIRLAAGSLAALLGTLLLAVSPLTLALATSPDSHAPTLLLVTSGMYLLLRWWTAGGALIACAAGLLLGAAVTLRYSEGLLLLPILLIIAYRLLPSSLRPFAPLSLRPGRLLEPALLLATFSLPILALLTFNLRALGSFTGYDATNESAPRLAFRFEHLLNNAPAILRQLHDTGLTFILPFSVAGLLCLFARNWRLALLLTLWVLPPLVLHAFYYWAPDHEALPITYLRLVMTTLPGLVLCATWLLPRLRITGSDLVPSSLPPFVPSSTALLVTLAILCLSGLLSTRTALQLLEAAQSHRLALASDTDVIRAAMRDPAAARQPLLFTPNRSLANHLQYALPARLYDAALFDARHIRGVIGKKSDKSRPDSLDPRRPRALERYLTTRFESRFLYSPDLLTPERWIDEVQHLLDEDRTAIIRAALSKGRRVFHLHQTTRPQEIPRIIDAEIFSARVAATWQTYAAPASASLPDTLRNKPARTSGGTDSQRQYQAAWQLIEITAKAPSTQPAAAPTPIIPDPEPSREGE